MKVLVTGASGFLGHNLIKYLLKEECEIRALITQDDDACLLEFCRQKIEIVRGDIRNAQDVEKAVEGCDIVFHLVGMIAYWKKLNDLQYDINVNGSRNVAQSCIKHKIKKLVYVSSTAACGVLPKGLADEDTVYNLFPYKLGYCDSKFLAEHEILKAGAKGVDVSIICPGSMYGAGDVRRIKSDMIFNFHFPFSLTFFDGNLAVADVEDVCRALIAAWKKGGPGERYIIVSENLSFFELRSIIAKALGKSMPFVRLPSWLITALGYLLEFAGDEKKPKVTPEMGRITTINFSFSNKKSKKELNMRYTPFAKTIEKQVEWYRTNGYL
ncbi:MAG TPA: NAD-dependent epimerase/dehydratase family protein [Candidatus Pacearchaeota archaeon]|nr:NAD-dependent epimerase/dehydratase family protein [Candidatus Pacearchaeota archaeon]